MKKSILGVEITDAKEEYVLKYVLDSLGNSREKYTVVTPNPEIIVYATKHLEFMTILNQARLSLADGIGVLVASWILGKPLHSRITGTDFMQRICREIAKKPITVGFLGGRENIAELTAECLQSRYPGLHVVFAAAEWGAEGFENAKRIVRDEDIKILSDKKGNTPHIDMLFVAYGFPKQETWIASHLAELPVTVAMGVGGAFDYISGKVPRAPKLMRQMGLEWLFRLIRQPWRAKRQLALFTFLLLVLKERLIRRVE